MAKPIKDAMPPATEAKIVYVCTCGYQETNSGKFGGHIVNMHRKEPGKHTSKGLINVATGEVIRPPAAQRTQQQKTAAEKESRMKRKAAKEATKLSVTQFTSNLASAQQIQFVPRIVTVDFSPIMRAAYDCARNLWGWDMDFGDFLDTWLYNSFKEHKVTLNTYTVDETEEERLAREAELKNDGHEIESEEEPEEANVS